MRQKLTLLVFGVLALFVLADCSKAPSKDAKNSSSATETAVSSAGEEIDISSPEHELNKAPKIDIPADATDRQKAAIEKTESLLYLPEQAHSEAILKKEMLSGQEGFSEEEVQYAIDLFKPDWNKQALKFAKITLKNSERGYSISSLKKFLKYEVNGFTEKQAAYAVSHLDASESDWKAQAILAASKTLDSANSTRVKIKKALLSGGFTEEEASYAVKHVKTDWNEKAAQAAQLYLTSEVSHYSKASLRERLLLAGFKKKEAAYGVEHSGADWNAQAVKAANNVLATSEPTKARIKKLLLLDDFTEKEISYAIKHVKTDWKENAVKAAQFYLNSKYSLYYSEASLKDKLLSDGFSKEEVKYGLEKSGADWNAQAVKAAKSYRDSKGMKKAAIKKQLISEEVGFTEEQAQYGINHMND